MFGVMLPRDETHSCEQTPVSQDLGLPEPGWADLMALPLCCRPCSGSPPSAPSAWRRWRGAARAPGALCCCPAPTCSTTRACWPWCSSPWETARPSTPAPSAALATRRKFSKLKFMVRGRCAVRGQHLLHFGQMGVWVKGRTLSSVHRKYNSILKAVSVFTVKRTCQIHAFSQLKQERDGSNLSF